MTDSQHTKQHTNKPSATSTNHQTDLLASNTPKIAIWRCPKCGQTIFTLQGEDVPDMCDYCGDMTTWQALKDAST